MSIAAEKDSATSTPATETRAMRHALRSGNSLCRGSTHNFVVGTINWGVTMVRSSLTSSTTRSCSLRAQKTLYGRENIYPANETAAAIAGHRRNGHTVRSAHLQGAARLHH